MCCRVDSKKEVVKLSSTPVFPGFNTLSDFSNYNQHHPSLTANTAQLRSSLEPLADNEINLTTELFGVGLEPPANQNLIVLKDSEALINLRQTLDVLHRGGFADMMMRGDNPAAFKGAVLLMNLNLLERHPDFQPSVNGRCNHWFGQLVVDPRHMPCASGGLTVIERLELLKTPETNINLSFVMALKSQRMDLLTWFIKQGAYPSSTNLDRENALHVVCKSILNSADEAMHEKLVELLILDVDVFHFDHQQKLPFDWVQGSKTELVDKLIQTAQQPNSQIDPCTLVKLKAIKEFYETGTWPEMATLFEGLAERGNAHAQYQFAKHCFKPVQQIPCDTNKALKLLKKAVDQGHVLAKCLLSNVLINEPNSLNGSLQEALKLTDEAAKQGHCVAQYELGMRYLHGEGLQQNLIKAHNWFFHAACQGHIDAQIQVADMCVEGRDVAVNLKQALQWYKMAAKFNSSIAFGRLHEFYCDYGHMPEYREEALTHFENVNTNSTDPYLRMQANWNLSRLFEQSNKASSFFCLVQALEISLEHPEYLNTETIAKAILDRAHDKTHIALNGILTPLDEIEAYANPYNPASYHLMKKLGYLHVQHIGESNVHLAGFALSGVRMLDEITARNQKIQATCQEIHAQIGAELASRKPDTETAANIQKALKWISDSKEPISREGFENVIPDEVLRQVWTYISRHENPEIKNLLTDAFFRNLEFIVDDESCPFGYIVRLLETPEKIDTSLEQPEPPDEKITQEMLGIAGMVNNYVEERLTESERLNTDNVIRLKEDITRRHIENRMLGYRGLSPETVERLMPAVLNMIKDY